MSISTVTAHYSEDRRRQRAWATLVHIDGQCLRKWRAYTDSAALASKDSLSILLFTNVLLPVDSLTVELFLDRDMGHG